MNIVNLHCTKCHKLESMCSSLKRRGASPLVLVPNMENVSIKFSMPKNGEDYNNENKNNNDVNNNNSNNNNLNTLYDFIDRINKESISIRQQQQRQQQQQHHQRHQQQQQQQDFNKEMVPNPFKDSYITLQSKQLLSKSYSINSNNCTLDYLLIFDGFELSSLSSSIPVNFYGGKSIVNNQVSIRVSNISVGIGEVGFIIFIQDTSNTLNAFSIVFDEPCSELPNNLNPRYYFDKWINVKSRLLKDPPKLTMYFGNLNGIGDSSNFLIYGNLIRNSSTFYQREFETKVLEFPYTFTSAINNIVTIEWYHLNSLGKIVESNVFTPPVSEPPGLSSIIYYPDSNFWSNHDNILFSFNVTGSVENYVLVGFNSTSKSNFSDAMNLYPIYGNPKNGKYVGFIN
ncbi:hypothetical protein ACTA71_012337 [Dictyostelium dimigraforme]